MPKYDRGRLTKERFMELAAAAGANRFLASDLWFFRPKTMRSVESVTMAFQLLSRNARAWYDRNNSMAASLARHEYMPGTGRRCERCNYDTLAAVHNTEPLDQGEPAA